MSRFYGIETLYDNSEVIAFADALKARNTFRHISDWIEMNLGMEVFGPVQIRALSDRERGQTINFGDLVAKNRAEDYPVGLLRVLENAKRVDSILEDKHLGIYSPCIIEGSDTTKGLLKTYNGAFNYAAALMNGGWQPKGEEHWPDYDKFTHEFLDVNRFIYLTDNKDFPVDRVVLELRDVPKISKGRMFIVIGKEIKPSKSRFRFFKSKSDAVDISNNGINNPEILLRK